MVNGGHINLDNERGTLPQHADRVLERVTLPGSASHSRRGNQDATAAGNSAGWQVTLSSYLPLITGGGGAIVVLVLAVWMFLTDKVHPDGEFQRILAALNAEKEAHARTREALAIASARAEAGMRPAELLAAVLQNTKERVKDAPEIDR